MNTWDMWVDFHRLDQNGLLLGSTRDVRQGFIVRVGAYIVIGDDDSQGAVARIVQYEPDTGLVRLQILYVEDSGGHRH